MDSYMNGTGSLFGIFCSNSNHQLQACLDRTILVYQSQTCYAQPRSTNRGLTSDGAQNSWGVIRTQLPRSRPRLRFLIKMQKPSRPKRRRSPRCIHRGGSAVLMNSHSTHQYRAPFHPADLAAGYHQIEGGRAVSAGFSALHLYRGHGQSGTVQPLTQYNLQ